MQKIHFNSRCICAQLERRETKSDFLLKARDILYQLFVFSSRAQFKAAEQVTSAYAFKFAEFEFRFAKKSAQSKNGNRYVRSMGGSE